MITDTSLTDKVGHNEFLQGTVTKAGIMREEVTYYFTYSVLKQRGYTPTPSVMPLEFIKPTERIKTSRIDIPFVIGDKVTMYDKRIMTVTAVEKEIDAKRAVLGIFNPHIAWLITLEGGE